MDPEDRRKVMEIFQTAGKLTGPERETFLQETCGDDEQLRKEVEELITSDGQATEILEKTVSRPIRADQKADTEYKPGDRIASYRLVSVLGEGGMGTVFLAEQLEPVCRKVALKLLKRDMDTLYVASRFESERHALALMNHSCIARVYDAGNTDSGRPFFVMEYVPGLAITDFCDTHQLRLSERLHLFRRVCDAVQHAHQRGLVHRDIKPSNILVCLEDEKPVPKVIDFGIAKAFKQNVTEETLFADTGILMGTPAYMSPEQANNLEDVDTRTDIYALGILLYEILLGVLPFQFKGKTFHQILNTILHRDPPTMKGKLTSLDEHKINDVAEKRKTTPKLLKKKIKGDLNWITFKAIHKDKSLRYASASEMAEDVYRYMNLQPVSAGPPGAGYHMKKFIRRHRWGVAAAAFCLLALIFGTVLATLGYVRAHHAEEKARLEAQKAKTINEFLETMLSSPNPEEDGRNVKMVDVLKSAVTSLNAEPLPQPEVEIDIRNTLGNTYYHLGLFKEAEDLIQQAIKIGNEHLEADHPATLRAQETLGELTWSEGDLISAEKILRNTLHVQENRLGAFHRDTLLTKNALAGVCWEQGKVDEALEMIRSIYEYEVKEMGEEHDDTLALMSNYANALSASGKAEEAIPLFQKVYRIYLDRFGADHPKTLSAMNELALAHENPDDAIAILEIAAQKARSKLGMEEPLTSLLINNLGYCYRRNGNFNKALELYQEALEGKRKLFGPDNARSMHTEWQVAGELHRLGHLEELRRLCDYRFIRAKPEGLELWRNLGRLYALAGGIDQAGACCSRGLKLDPDDFILNLINAFVMWKKGETDRADQVFSRLLKKEPDSDELEYIIPAFKDVFPEKWYVRMEARFAEITNTKP